MVPPVPRASRSSSSPLRGCGRSTWTRSSPTAEPTRRPTSRKKNGFSCCPGPHLHREAPARGLVVCLTASRGDGMSGAAVVDSFRSRGRLTVGEADYEVFRLAGVEGADRLPFSLKVLLENLLRNEDGRPSPQTTSGPWRRGIRA